MDRQPGFFGGLDRFLAFRFFNSAIHNRLQLGWQKIKGRLDTEIQILFLCDSFGILTQQTSPHPGGQLAASFSGDCPVSIKRLLTSKSLISRNIGLSGWSRHDGRRSLLDTIATRTYRVSASMARPRAWSPGTRRMSAKTSRIIYGNSLWCLEWEWELERERESVSSASSA